MFSHPDGVRHVGEAFGVNADTVLGVEDGDRLIAALPLLEREKGPFVALVAPVLVPFVTPVLAAKPRETDTHQRRSALDRLLEAMAADYDRATLLLHPSIDDGRPLHWAGWYARTRYTYLVDLAATPDPLSLWSSGARRTATKARDGYTFEDGPEFAPSALDLMIESYHRQGESLSIDRDAVLTLAQRLAQDGLARTFAVRDTQGQIDAALIVAHDGKTAHYWIAGSRPGPGMTVLLAHVLPLLRQDGIQTFDFMGANVPSIAEFKRRFGPTLTPYVLAQQDFHPALRALRRIAG